MNSQVVQFFFILSNFESASSAFYAKREFPVYWLTARFVARMFQKSFCFQRNDFFIFAFENTCFETLYFEC